MQLQVVSCSSSRQWQETPTAAAATAEDAMQATPIAAVIGRCTHASSSSRLGLVDARMQQHQQQQQQPVCAYKSTTASIRKTHLDAEASVAETVESSTQSSTVEQSSRVRSTQSSSRGYDLAGESTDSRAAYVCLCTLLKLAV